MNAIPRMACASSGESITWTSINWADCDRNVRKLQARIVKAVRGGRWGKVKALQWLLTHSLSGKALAVKRVTENKGKRTPGVDGEIWKTPATKTGAMLSLTRRGYKPQALRRVYIPKSNGKLRPLGIPTMKDRAMQALHLLALDPISETTADKHSYGFRKGRATRDALEQCFKLCSPKRGQLVSSAAAVVQLNISNPSAARAPANWSGVKRVRTRDEQLHERNLLFPRWSYFSGDFHLVHFPQVIRTFQASRSAAEDELNQT